MSKKNPGINYTPDFGFDNLLPVSKMPIIGRNVFARFTIREKARLRRVAAR